MKKEFIVERQGKSFVLYAGLLDLAHEKGLKSIVTTLAQIPHESNNHVAICSCVVSDGGERIFTGIGDASPQNVAPVMKTCLIRMAETRAKARALRDMVNIGVAAMEELGPEEPETPPVATRSHADEFKARAEKMGYEGKLSPLCCAIVGKASVQAVDYAEALKRSPSEWNRAIDAQKESGQ